jgi:hypothetical protein
MGHASPLNAQTGRYVNDFCIFSQIYTGLLPVEFAAMVLFKGTYLYKKLLMKC